jgi:formate hydrogenlyase transcriptional activator
MATAEFRELLLGVWREACRHIEIHESTATIARMLPPLLPVDGIVVRALDLKRSRLETVAAGLTSSGPPDETHTDCDPPRMRRLLAWCKRGEIGRRLGPDRSAGDREEWGAAVPDWIVGEVLVGPLASREQPLGLLLFIARAGAAFAEPHEEMLRALLEPFAVALENHHRLRQLAALREAAEADKESLLARLGRRQLADTIVGADAGLRPVMERVELVARSDVPVLILGETGAGKEVIARAIHTGSPRAGGPFIRVNCGAIPPELLDSQLFGHERGSFTGAAETRRGWLERADGGTLFLDEIGELPPAAQVRLLRVLQDGYLERVGAQEPIRVDLRVVAATHRDLMVMVREGRFREDLWYRVGVFPVVLPPLRERPGDIPALARHFAERAATRFGLPLRFPSGEDMAALMAYPWPGNVRELAAVIDRAAILGQGERLHVATALGVAPLAPAPERAPAEPAGTVTAPRLDSLDAAMRRHIEAALATTRGRVEGPDGAARLLQINPHTLRARMRRLGIDWGRFRSRA